MNYLWTDTTVFQNRYEKNIYALVAIKQALERHQLIDSQAQEFFSLYEKILAIDSQHFTRVFSDPTAHFWIRIAYELVKNCLTSTPLSSFAQNYCQALEQQNPRLALAIHLAEFKKFVLAIHYLADKDCIFNQPLNVSLPFALPGTRLAVAGEHSVNINGLQNGQLLISSVNSHQFTIKESPVINHNSYELLLQPYSFNLPGITYAQPVLEADFAYQEKYAGLVQEALILVERYQPQIYSQFEDFLYLLALKPLRAGNYTNISDSDLPGAFVCSVIDDPFEFADTLIHEFHHNRLFFIEENSPILTDSTEQSLIDSNYYSPWRKDLRPLRGLLHALYVYLPVCRFWLEVYKSGDVFGKRLDYVRSQIVRISLQLRIAAYQIARYGDFTAFGAKVFTDLQQNVAEIQADVAQLNLSANIPAIACHEDGSLVVEINQANGQPASVYASLVSHIQKFDSLHQCDEGLLNQLTLTPLFK